MSASKPKPWRQQDFYAGATPEALARALLRPVNSKARERRDIRSGAERARKRNERST